MLTGDDLKRFSEPVRHYVRRACCQSLVDFLRGDPCGRVFILYGLKHTGKTTMIRQCIGGMTDVERSQTALIRIANGTKLADLYRDLSLLQQRGIRTVFIDEATRAEGFIDNSALLSDIFSACGMKIVLSGADSLGFQFALDDQLYDRCVLLHTTFIPYRDCEAALGIKSIDEYMRCGGTMLLGDTRCGAPSTFAKKQSADEYVDQAVAQNIRHALQCSRHAGDFRHLQTLLERHELTGAVNRIVEGLNRRFMMEVLARGIKSYDLRMPASNLSTDPRSLQAIPAGVDARTVTQCLRRMLEILNREEQTVSIDEACIAEIKACLRLLDLFEEVDVVSLSDLNNKNTRTLIAQPGLRCAQATALIDSLLLDQTFQSLSLEVRNAVCGRVLSEVQGRMMEDIALLETKLAHPDKQVFVLQFPVGEFDMVVFDPSAANCRIFEIKHSSEAVPNPCRHLTDPEKCAQTKHRFGPILSKTVLYTGKPFTYGEVRYVNVEDYLRRLPDLDQLSS